jgi:hypothetical protein
MSWFFTLCLGVVLLAVGIFLAVREHKWLRAAQTTTGTVVELIPQHSSEGHTYKPRVEFTAKDGSRREFVSDIGSMPVGFSVGERVPVAYDPDTFEGCILTFGQRFGIASVVGAVGLGITALAAAFLVGKAAMPHLYLH